MDLVPKESLDLTMSEFSAQMRGEKHVSYAQSCIRKDGTIFYADIAGAPIVLNGRKCSVGFFNDVTDRKRAEDSLSESESTLRQAQEIAMMGSWELDLINRKTKLSENSFILYGLKPFELEFTFEYFKSRVHPDDLHIIDETFETIYKFKKTSKAEVRILFPDGNDKWAQINIAPVVVENELVALKGIQIDITDRKKTEEKIREKDIQFRKLSSNLPDLIFQFTRRQDGSYCVPIASEGIKNIFGCFPEDAVDDFAPIGRVIFPDDAERVISDIEYSAKHLTYFTCEFRVQIPGKPIQWIFSRSTPEKLADGSVTWYGFNADITELKQAEEKLKIINERFELATNAATFSVWEHNFITDIITIDDNFNIIYGTTHGNYQIEFYEFIQFIHPDDVDIIKNSIKEAIKLDKKISFEFRIIRTDGDIKNIQAHGKIVKDKNNKPIRFIGINIDISDFRKVEQELMRAKEHAEESDRLKSAFLANMSHEIRTPMNGILGFAQLLKEPKLSEKEQQQYLAIIDKSGKRMLKIINDIVSISKIESGQMEVSVSETNINEQMDFIYSFFKSETEKKGLQFSVKTPLPSKEVIIRSDREKIYAILTNLVNNAIKFTKAGSIEFGC